MSCFTERYNVVNVWDTNQRKFLRTLLKNNLIALCVDIISWETEHQSVWKKVIYDGCKAFEARRIEHSILKRALQKQDLTSVLETFQPQEICNICSQVYLSKAGLAIHIIYTFANRVLHKFFISDLKLIRINSKTKYRPGLNYWHPWNFST